MKMDAKRQEGRGADGLAKPPAWALEQTEWAVKSSAETIRF